MPDDLQNADLNAGEETSAPEPRSPEGSLGPRPSVSCPASWASSSTIGKRTPEMNILGRRSGLTLILLANSSGLARPFSLEAGDVTVSPFARLFLGIFVR